MSCLPERPDLPFSLWATTFRHLLLQAVCAPSIDTALLIDLGRNSLSCLRACFPCLLLGNCLYLWNLPSEEASFPTCICFDRVWIWGFSWCFWSQYCFSLILLAFQYFWQVVPKVCLVNPWESLETFLVKKSFQVKIIFFFVLVCTFLCTFKCTFMYFFRYFFQCWYVQWKCKRYNKLLAKFKIYQNNDKLNLTQIEHGTNCISRHCLLYHLEFTEKN